MKCCHEAPHTIGRTAIKFLQVEGMIGYFFDVLCDSEGLLTNLATIQRAT